MWIESIAGNSPTKTANSSGKKCWFMSWILNVDILMIIQNWQVPSLSNEVTCTGHENDAIWTVFSFSSIYLLFNMSWFIYLHYNTILDIL